MNDTAFEQEVVLCLAATPDFLRGGIGLAGTSTGLMRSVDGGASWSSAYASLAPAGPEEPGNHPLAPTPTPAVAISPAFATDRTVFAGVPGGVLRSADAGITWQAAALPDPPAMITALVISPGFVEDGCVLAGTMEDGVYRSDDRGATWTDWNVGLIDPHVLCLALSPDFIRDHTVFAGTETGLFRSRNRGLSWQEIPFPGDHPAILSLAVACSEAGDLILYAGTEENGPFASRDSGVTWQQLAGLPPGAINGILLGADDTSGPWLAVLCEDQILISANGRPWTPKGPESGVTAACAPEGVRPGAVLLAGLDDGTISTIS